MRRSGLATTSGSAGTGPGNDTGVWLIMTIILFALLCNYSRTICLIDVGTEGAAPAPADWASRPSRGPPLHEPPRQRPARNTKARLPPADETQHRAWVFSHSASGAAADPHGAEAVRRWNVRCAARCH